MIQTVAAPIASDEIRARAAEVLARTEFQPPEESWLARLLRKVFKGLESLDVSEGVVQVALWILLIALVVLLGWTLVRIARGMGMGAKPASDVPREPDEVVVERVRLLRQRAREARAAGDLALALRLAFFALVVGLGKRGDLEYRDSWTYRELLARGRVAGEVRALLEPLVVELERKSFGREPTRAEDVDQIEALAERWLAGEVLGNAA